jgi:beta-lactamase regulating signal transducer with metallopeptidase domain
MSTMWETFGDWLVRSAIGGGFLLALAWQLMRCCRQPARRQRLGEWGVLAAVLFSALSLGPHWVSVPLFRADLEPVAEAARQAQPLPTSSSHMDSLLGVEDFQDDAVGEDRLFPGGASVGLRADLPTLLAAADDISPSFGEKASSMNGDTRASLQDRASALLTSTPVAAIAGWLGIAYVVMASLLLGRWLLGHVTLNRLLRKARRAPAPVRSLFATMAASQRRLPRLLVSKRLCVPVSCGLWHPTVIVPSSLCRPNARQRLRWVLAHELTHLERRDAWSCLLFGLGQVLYFYLPWFWGLRRQVRLCQEYIADAAAGQAGEAEDYAQFLLTLTTLPAVPLGATGVLGNSSDLLRRVTMLLQRPLRVERSCPRWWSLATAAGLLATAVFTSGISLRAAAAAAPSSDEQRLVVVVDESDSTKSDDKKDSPEKKKEAKKEWSFKFDFPDIDEMLKNLPSNLDQEQMKQFREQMTKAREQMRQAMEQLKQQVDVRKELEKAWAQVPLRQGEFVYKGRRNPLERGGGRLGVRVAQPSETLADQLDLHKGNGLVIEDVVAGSAADKAGLKAHDVLLEFNGKMVSNEPGSFAKLVHDVKPDSTVDAVILRKGKKEIIKGISLPEEKKWQPTLGGVKAVPVQIIYRERGKGDGKDGHRVTITRNRKDDNFTVSRQEDGLSITVTGTVADGKAKVSEIEIQDRGKSNKYDGIDKVPEQYRDQVKDLVETGETGRIKLEKSQGKSEKDSRPSSKKESRFSSSKEKIINE